MKKILILALCSVFSASISAMDGPDTHYAPVAMVPKLNCAIPYQVTENICDLSWNAVATQDLAFQSEVAKSVTAPVYVASATLIDLCLFYRPVIYENYRQPEATNIYISGCNVFKDLSNVNTPDKIPIQIKGLS